MEKFGVLPVVVWMVAILSMWIPTPGSSLKCHVCNSLHNDSCVVVEDQRYVTDCHEINEDPDSRNYTLCRKEEFSVSSTKTGEKTSRTIRSCGYEKHPKFSCFYNSNHDLKETICECTEDACNDGNGGPVAALFGLSVCTLLLASFSLL